MENILVLIIIGLVLGYLFHVSSLRKKTEQLSSKKTFFAILKRHQCKYEKDSVSDEKNEFYLFKYQNGNFRVAFLQDEPYVAIQFLSFLTMPSSQINIARILCNEMNSSLHIPSQVVYSTDEEENEINLHLVVKTLLPDTPAMDKYFISILDTSFQIQRFLWERYEKMAKIQEDDVEKQQMESDHDLFLLSEQELREEEGKQTNRFNCTDVLSLGQLLGTLSEVEKENLLNMKIVADYDRSVLDNPEDIWNFNISTLLTEYQEDGSLKIRNGNATLVLNLRKQGRKERTVNLLIDFHAENEWEGILYFRVSMLTPSAEVKPNGNLGRGMHYDLNFLIAFDGKDAGKKKSEYDYMWQDAQDKLQKGNVKDISPAQNLLMLSENGVYSYNVYWGKRMFDDGRFYEALLYLENAYQVMQVDYGHLNETGRNAFYEICYMIGFIYTEFRNYVEAYYYLDAVFYLHRIRYTQEYVNCLVNAKDFRAISIIDNLLQTIEQSSENAEEGEPVEPDSEFLEFRNFLLRRRAYVYVDLGMLDEAEKEFKEMLKQPSNKDYALGELAYIQKLKQKK